MPPAEGHYCIVVHIRLYQDPATAGLFETNIFNNEARSNYTRFVSASSSPSTRVSAEIQLANPFEDSTIVHAVVNSSHPYHRVFLDHAWLRVDGKSSRPVQVYDEALAGFPEADAVEDERVLGRLWKEDNFVTVEGWSERPFLADCGAPTLTGGATVRVGAGRATEIEITDARHTFMAGRVCHVDDGSPVDGGTVVIVARELDEFGGHQTADGRARRRSVRHRVPRKPQGCEASRPGALPRLVRRGTLREQDRQPGAVARSAWLTLLDTRLTT